jgi:4'-phosphopantetheinyl transferase EntD
MMGSNWPQTHWHDEDAVLILDAIGDHRASLFSDEIALARDMTDQRALEFAAGRHVARTALVTLGLPGVSIPVGKGGEPLFPDGIAGSITHTSRHAAALVSGKRRYRSVGVDADDERALGTAAAYLMTAEEIALVMCQGHASSETQAQSVVFSAKEALFKCQYVATGKREMDFDEVMLVKSNQPRSFKARLVSPDPDLETILANIEIFPIQIHRVRCAIALLPHRT